MGKYASLRSYGTWVMGIQGRSNFSLGLPWCTNIIALQSRADLMVKHARDGIARRIALQLCLYTISRAAKQGEKNKSHDTFWASEMIRAIYNNKYGLICFFNVVNERFRLMLESV